MKQSARLFSSNGTFALNIDNSTAADTLCEFVLSYISEIDLHLAGTIGLRKKTGNAEPIYIFKHRKNIPWALAKSLGNRNLCCRCRGLKSTTMWLLCVMIDLLPGGTKRRGLSGGLTYVATNLNYTEFVYASSPRQGYAQLGLAYACRDWFRATGYCFCTRSKHQFLRRKDATTVDRSSRGAAARF